jgi:very-short-patch-repair endonuclease
MSARPGPDDPTPVSPEAWCRSVPESGTVRHHAVLILGVVSPVLVSGRREDRIAQIAALQRGRVAHRQLIAAGLTSSAIGRLITRGALIPERRAVYAVGHAAPGPWVAETSALLTAREGAALAGRSAGVTYEMLRPEPQTPIEIIVSGNKARLPGVIVHRSRTLTPADLRIRHGLPVTCPARTLLDLAAPRAGLSDRQLEVAYDRAVIARLVAAADVNGQIERNRGHPGRRRLATLLAAHTGATTITRSDAEERLLGLLRRAQLPLPALNQPLLGFEVDFLWAAQRLVVEVDGYRYHSTRGSFERDHRKDIVLRSAGYIVIRVSARQLVEEPLAVIAAIAQSLGGARGADGQAPGTTRAPLRTRANTNGAIDGSPAEIE